MSNYFEVETADVAIERTRNYIKFQIHQTEQELASMPEGLQPICYAHLHEYRKNLMTELYELNRVHRQSR